MKKRFFSLALAGYLKSKFEQARATGGLDVAYKALLRERLG
jgi:hypothetical protein